MYKFWRILPGIFLEDFSGHFFPQKMRRKKSGEKIREKIRRLKNKNPRKIRSAESRPLKNEPEIFQTEVLSRTSARHVRA